jgi:hypothetical protein
MAGLIGKFDFMFKESPPTHAALDVCLKKLGAEATLENILHSGY